jgi:acetyl coenzyme A synthetase (ADP forming)-like protein
LDAILKPRSVAIIGASRREGSIGWQILHNLLTHRFQGAVYPVNPRVPTVHSIRAYASIGDVPEPVDLAILVVPAPAVLPVVRECAAAEVKGIVIITAGFKEIGGDGVQRQAEVVEALRGTGIRTVGPNCMGVMNTSPEVSLNATFAPSMPHPGPVAFLSQSGAMGVSILDQARSLGIGISQFVSVGNKMDVSGNDMLEYWRDDPDTGLILMYLESIANASRFVALGQQITRKKPLFVVKSGRTGAGARAASSHTGALAQTDLITDSIIKQAGAIRAQTVEELFDYAMAFGKQPLPSGNRVAVVTNAGGPGIIIADACEVKGLEVVALSEDTRERLRSKLPQEASVQNPVDLIASADANAYEHALQCVLGDANVDAVIAAFVPPLGIHAKDIADAIVRAAAKNTVKPVMAVLMGKEGLPAGLAELHAANIPAYIFPESAARALTAMWRYSKMRNQELGSVHDFDIDHDEVTRLIEGTRKAGHIKVSEPDALRVLQAAGIPVVPWTTVENGARLAQRTAAQAAELGYPVALKVISPDISHKSDVGGIEVGIANDDECVAAVQRILDNVVTRGGFSVDGILVQRMAEKGIETILGLTRNPGMPPIVMFGLGGIYVEVMKDVVMRLCPVRDSDAAQMVRGVKMHALLRGVRGDAPRDLGALEEAIQRLSQLSQRHPEILEMDINPMVSLAHGAGAIDARIRIEE